MVGGEHWRSLIQDFVATRPSASANDTVVREDPNQVQPQQPVWSPHPETTARTNKWHTPHY